MPKWLDICDNQAVVSAALCHFRQARRYRLFRFQATYSQVVALERLRAGSTVLANYFPVLLFILIGLGLGIALLTAGRLIGPSNPGKDKNSPYECGFEAFEDARMKFDVRYYLVAILFIIFDLEIAFLIPWAISLDAISGTAFAAMGIFLFILVIGFIYEWKKGALEWE